MSSITKTIDSYSLAFGIEDGVRFCAILWPETQGELPFTDRAFMRFHLDGFVLFSPSRPDVVLGFFGVDSESKTNLLTHQVVVLSTGEEGFNQLEVTSHHESPAIFLN